MQARWIIREGRPRLLVVLLGWACDERALAGADFDGYDLLCVYDYRDMDTLPPALAGALASYGEAALVAWSFGVWAAERLEGTLFAQGNLRLTIAVNGTGRPVDDRFGIPVRAFAVTVRSIRTQGPAKFYERMYGGKPDETTLCRRPSDELAEELALLGDRFGKEGPGGNFRWDRVLIGTEDRIFPPDAIRLYWEEKAIFAPVTAPLPHFPFGAEGKRLLSALLHDTQ